MTPPICAAMVSEAERRNENPEGIDVPVPVSDEALAKRIAISSARCAWPDRHIGGVIHSEPHLSGWVITVQDNGPKRPR